jgi:transposase
MRDLLIESQTREPAPRQVHPLLRILLIGYLYGITSERKLVEELAHSVLISDE